jgi:hypothetical protein
MSILLRIRHLEENERNAKVMAQIAQETDPNIDLRPSSDDRNQRLRGIPAVGRNVAGAIPGSSPHAIR